MRDQRRNGGSLLQWFEELTRTLPECPEIGVGTPTVLDLPGRRSVLVHRFDAWKGSILLLHNLSGRRVTCDRSSLDLGPDPSELLPDAPYPRSTRPYTMSSCTAKATGGSACGFGV